MSLEIGRIYNRDGLYVGKYENGICSEADASEQLAVSKQPPAVVTNDTPSAWKAFSKLAQSTIQDLFAPAPPAIGCGNAPESKGPDSIIDVPVSPPVITPDLDAGDKVLDSGTIIRNDAAILPTDDAGIVIPDDIFGYGMSTFELNRAEKYQLTPEILLQAKPTPENPEGFIAISGIQNTPLQFEMGTDSPEYFSQLGINENNCLDDLINTTQISQADIDAGIKGCPDPGFESFLACPTNANNRLKTYVASYIMVGKKFDNGQWVTTKEIPGTLTKIEDLYIPDGGTIKPFGHVCGDAPNPLKIDVPQDFGSDGTTNVQFRVVLIADAENASKGTIYKNYLKAHLIKKQ